MTNSVYTTLATIKKASATIDEPEYMDINADEAEAGSILMSLSQHTKRMEGQPSTTTNTMSIRNLLDNDEEAPAHQEQAKTNGRMFTDPSKSTIAHRYPEAVKEAHANGIYGHKIASTASPSPDTSTHMEVITQQQRQCESNDWQHERRSSYNTYQHHQNHRPYPTPEWTQHRPSYLPHQHHYQQQQQHTMPQQQPMKKPYHRYDPQQQHQPSLRKRPKVRRSALHVYISYMTYTDLKRMKSDAPPPLQLQHYGSQSVPKQNVHPPSTSLPKQPAVPNSLSVHQQHHQPPLTAFLKDTVEPTAPTTPIPKSSLPPIESHRHSTDWSDRHYHSSPPPPPAHYRHPYPTPSFPTK